MSDKKSKKTPKLDPGSSMKRSATENSAASMIPTLSITSDDDIPTNLAIDLDDPVDEQEPNNAKLGALFIPSPRDEDANSTAPLLDSGGTTPATDGPNHGMGPFLHGGAQLIPSVQFLRSTSSTPEPSVNQEYMEELINEETPMQGDGKNVPHVEMMFDTEKLPSYFFLDWNWPAVRLSCFFVYIAILIACISTAITLIIMMPTNCDPPLNWWQGEQFYEIFVPSFRDTNGDGIGDIQGVIDKLDYIQHLGFRGVRLNSIFQARDKSFPEDYLDIVNTTAIDPHVGDLEDFQRLRSELTKKNMTLLLDFHLDKFTASHPSHYDPENPSSPMSVSIEPPKPTLLSLGTVATTELDKFPPTLHHIVKNTLQFWGKQGVDGFYFKGLELFAHLDISKHVIEWKSLVEREFWSTNHHAPIFICSSAFLRHYTHQAKHHHHKEVLHRQFELVDHQLDLTKNVTQIIHEIQEILKLERDPGGPWVQWNVGRSESHRLADVVSSLFTHGNLMLPMILPGSGSVFYGDEVGLLSLKNHDDVHHLSQLTPMIWDASSSHGFTFQSSLPWLPFQMSATSVQAVELAKDIFHRFSEIKRKSPPLRVNAIIKYEGDVFVSKVTNMALHQSGNELLMVERFFPRRHRYLLILNLAQNRVVKDLSRQFFGGTVVVDSMNKNRTGYQKFDELEMDPGEALLVQLDK